MAEFQTFHTGRPLNLWERSCLTSFVDHGHKVALFSYEPIDVPAGVRLASARDIVSEPERNEFFRVDPAQTSHGWVSHFSDLFRWRLLQQRGNWWIDTDLVCLSDALPTDDIVFGAEVAGFAGTAIMRFPAGHPLLGAAIEFSTENRHREEWAAIGPKLLTRLLATYRLESAVREPAVFYPVHWSEVHDLLDPELRDRMAAKTDGSATLHLWQHSLQRLGFQRDFLPPSGSYLHDAFRKHGGRYAQELDPECLQSQILRLRQFLDLRKENARLQGEIEQTRREVALAHASATARDGAD